MKTLVSVGDSLGLAEAEVAAVAERLIEVVLSADDPLVALIACNSIRRSLLYALRRDPRLTPELLADLERIGDIADAHMRERES